jgi:hypothetical protein
MKEKEDLIRTAKRDVMNEYFGHPFHYEYFGDEIDLLNMLLEREELTPQNSYKIGMGIFGSRQDRSGRRKDKGVQLAYHHGFGGGNVYIVIPSKMDIQKGKKIRVFADVAQPDGAIRATCISFIKTFEMVYPFKNN